MTSTVGAMRKRARLDGYETGYREGHTDGVKEGREEAVADFSLFPPGTSLGDQIEVEMALRSLDERGNPIASRILTILLAT